MAAMRPNRSILAVLTLLCLPAPAGAAAELPKPELKLLGPGVRLDAPPADKLTVAPGATLELRAKVMGGQRAWCMSPETYANVGKNTTINHHGLDGCEYEVNTGEYNRVGTWAVTKESYTWSATGGTIVPKGEGEHATFTAPAQPGTVTITATGSVSWHLESVAKRDVVDGPVTATVTIEVAGAAAALTPDKARELILARFFGTIPSGPAGGETLSYIGSPGFANNVKDLVGVDGYGAFACGGYQGRVLDMLDVLREKGTADEKAIFEHWDYGPVQAYYGGHQAVVIYPKGGDWQKDGVVLDPWPNQRPETYPIADWKSRFSFGVGPSGVYQGHYPLTGGTEYPTNQAKLPPELVSVFRTLPPAEKDKLRVMSPKERADYLRALAPEQKARVAVGTHSPVKLLVTDASGRRVGYLGDGTFVVEIEGTDLDLPPEADGTRGAMFFLPYGAYDVDIRGEAEGRYGVTLAVPAFAPGEKVVRYQGVATSAGASMRLRLDPAAAARPALAGADGVQVAAAAVPVPAAAPAAASPPASQIRPAGPATAADAGKVGDAGEGAKKKCGCAADPGAGTGAGFGGAWLLLAAAGLAATGRRPRARRAHGRPPR
jgi:hypothetical protein